MRHFLFEFITGGGLSDQPLLETLIGEGEIMVQTLLNELIEADYLEISLCRDSRLALFDYRVEQCVIDGMTEGKLLEFIKKSDVLWLIAPETNDCLIEYAELFINTKKIFIGSTLEAIRISTSKSLTNRKLSEAGINVVETMCLGKEISNSKTGWVVKPDAAAGGEGIFLINDKNKLIKLAEEEGAESLIVQPYIEGKHMSISLLAFNGDVRLLACNKQYVDVKNGVIKLEAIGVNECLSFKNEMLNLAKKIISTISGFAGYIGVDLIEKDGELYVLEVNPRFTTAYAGLSESLGCNITVKIFDTFLNKKLPDIDLSSAKQVRINI